MNPKLIIQSLGIGLPLLLTALTATAAEKDPTKYDCRVTVRIERYSEPGSKIPGVRFVKECPHKAQMAAGQCETHWLFGMRCKN
jgi:hypothetical protein